MALVFNPKEFLAAQSRQSGVYRMYDKSGEVLYVGKAKNLKNRLSSYFRVKGLAVKTVALVEKIADIDVIITNTEAEALILEQNLIKDNRPPYNILLRDDKSYPYVFISADKHYPRLGFYRGRKRPEFEYFGPYPSTSAIRESMNILQKVFKVRQCEDSYYRSRSRPCLQYQLNRCKAPCTGLVSEEEYQQDIKHSRLFLSGKSQEVIYDLLQEMENASGRLEFEQAAELRDQVSHLRAAQEQQVIDCKGGNLDAVASCQIEDQVCFVVLSIREGRMLGNRSYFHRTKIDSSMNEMLEGFLGQYYLGKNLVGDPPEEIITANEVGQALLLQDVISAQVGKTLEIRHRVRGDRANWLRLAQKNARQSLSSRINQNLSQQQRYADLQALLQLDSAPTRMECFDISHSSGEATVAACVVFGESGPLKSDYRRFNISGVTPGDDYAAMRQALLRRYSRVLKEEGKLPDILFIDGGKGQLSMAYQVLEELKLTELLMVGVAKGESRKPGLETLIVHGTNEEIHLPRDSGALLLIQSIRDEAHRFAITGHRQRRAKRRNSSRLEDIEGVGVKRRQELLKFFGGMQGVTSATVDELIKVRGISKQLGQSIFDALHPE